MRCACRAILRRAVVFPACEHPVAFNYQFGGIRIGSDVRLGGLHEAIGGVAQSPDIQVFAEPGSPPAQERLNYAWRGRFGMRLGTVGDGWLISVSGGAFLVDRSAQTIRIFGLDGLDGGMLGDIFARRVLPRLIKLKGAAIYHAASLALDGRGVLLMGPSGAGKSTMAIGLAATGDWNLLGDDMAILWHGDGDDGGDRIAPAAANATIWSQSCEGLGLTDRDCSPLAGYDGKRIFRQQHRLPAVPTSAKAIVFLSRIQCSAPVLERCSKVDAFQRALSQIIFFDPSGPATAERVQSVSRLNQMLSRVPAFCLTYPASYAAIGDVSDAIRSVLETGEYASAGESMSIATDD